MLTDEVVVDKLKVKEESLTEYEGDTLSEKYRNKIKTELVEEFETKKTATVEESFWEHVKKTATYKRLPEGEVNRLYNYYFNNIKQQYTDYGYDQYYPDFDNFLRTNYELEATEDPREYIRNIAKSEVEEKLAFYALLKMDGLLPTEEEFASLYKIVVKESFDNQSSTTYDSEEKYNNALMAYEMKTLKNYGDDYFDEVVYYRHGIEKLLSFATIVNKAAPATN
jgi:FKBP-type peptidyl-prolyl cis-trans isomerase (trigger factor)